MAGRPAQHLIHCWVCPIGPVTRDADCAVLVLTKDQRVNARYTTLLDDFQSLAAKRMIRMANLRPSQIRTDDLCSSREPSGCLTVAASHPAWVCRPAVRVVVDRFDSSALAPIRPAIALLRTLRCPQRFGHRLPLCQHWLGNMHRRRPQHLFDTPCRIARRNGSWAIPSLSRATPSATSEHLRGLLESSSIPRSSSLLAF